MQYTTSMSTHLEQESHFGYDELFFSKTDHKGIILEGNSIFQRVSEFEWSDLLNRPHNVIRHPDMPRGVFHLLWSHLKAARPLGAFVKNRSRTGKHYWVFALALPVQNGYISVRLKPGGPLLDTVANEYRKLREIELRDKISPEASEAALLKVLEGLGFKTYSAFMAYALSNQIENRYQQLNKEVPKAVRAMKEMSEASTKVLDNTKRILTAYNESRFIPLNLEVQAAHLEQDGGQLSVIAAQYQKMMSEITDTIGRFNAMSTKVTERIESAQFLIGANELMSDAVQYLAAEESAKDLTGITDIADLSDRYTKNAFESAREIGVIVDEFISICAGLQTLATGLEMVRLTGKVEAARLPKADDIGSFLASLKSFQVSLTEGLAQILASNRRMGEGAKILRKELA